MSGQSITDRITAAQHSVTGSAVSKTVCKATTHEVMGPKKKHLDCEYLTNELNHRWLTENRLKWPSYGDGESARPQKPQTGYMLTASSVSHMIQLLYYCVQIFGETKHRDVTYVNMFNV